MALSALGLLGAAGFAILTWLVTSGGAPVRRDGRVLHWFLTTAAAHPGFGTTAHYLCKLGNVQVAVPVLLAAVVGTGWRAREAGLPRWWLPPAAAALAMCLVPLVVTVVKDAVHRPPPGLTVPDPSGYGYFPSGHTATSSVAFGAAALLVLPWVRRGARRVVLAAGTALLVVAVGFALVWCDYHWPTDVLASWCMAVVLLSGVAAAQALAAAASRAAPAPAPAPGTGGGDADGSTSGDDDGDGGDGGDVSCSSGSPG